MTRFYLTQFHKAVTINEIDYTSHYYVYEWRDGFKVFYIGSGTGRRAWKEHLPLPENKRIDSGDRFRVYIVRDGMTKTLAHTIERYHMLNAISRGIKLLNKRIPNNVGSQSKRQRKDHNHNQVGRSNRNNPYQS